MPTPCEDLVTKAELQELRDQLNAVIGEKEEGGSVSIFEAGKNPLVSATLIGGTFLGSTRFRAAEAITNLIAEPVTSTAPPLQSVPSKVNWFNVRGNGTKLPLPDLTKVSKVATEGAVATELAAKTAVTASAGVLLLSNLANIAASLGLNIATINVLDARIDAEAKGTQVAVDSVNAGMLRLYQKNQGDINAANAEIDGVRADLTTNQNKVSAVEADVRRNRFAIESVSEKLQEANFSIADLQQQTQSLRDELSNFKPEVTEAIVSLDNTVTIIETQLLEAAAIIAEQKVTITELETRIEALETVVADLGFTVGVLDARLHILQFEFDQLKQDLTEDKELANAKAKLTEARLIILEHRNSVKSGGGTSASVKQEVASTQNGLLELANRLTGTQTEPETIHDYDLDNNSQKFKQQFEDLLPNIESPKVQKQQIEELKTDISTDFKKELGLAIGTLLLPGLVTIQNQTTPQALSQGAQSGICNSLNGGGCPVSPGNLNPTQGLGAMMSKLLGGQDVLNAGLNATIITQNNGLRTIAQSTNDIVSHRDYGLKKVQSFASTAWKATHGDKILNAITTAVVIHNGVMLSRGLGNTLADVATITLQAMGVHDSDDKPFDVQSILSAKLTQLIDFAIGEEKHKALTDKIASYSRVYQSAANLADLTFSLFDSARNIAESSAVNTGKIGNALREAGAVYEDAYGEMSEKYSPQNKAMRKLSGLTENVQDFAEKADRIGEMSGGVIEIKESYAELQSERQVLEHEVKLALDLKKEEKDLAKKDVLAKTEVNNIDFDPAPSENS